VRLVSTITLIAILLAGCQGQDRGGASPKLAMPLVVGVLSKGQVSGSLEYCGRCDLNQIPDFPKLHAPEKSRGSAVQDLQEMFADDPEMRVTQEPDGMIRMVEADVPRDLLDLRISHISFKLDYGPGDVLYDPRDALRAILNAPEVRAFMTAQNIGTPFDFEEVHGPIAVPSPKLPHISGSLDNVTLSQALDYVSRTFPGLWVYENCPSKKRKRAVFFTFFRNGPVG
jgi:hypothetical protein